MALTDYQITDADIGAILDPPDATWSIFAAPKRRRQS
jgi:hypothetical protein